MIKPLLLALGLALTMVAPAQQSTPNAARSAGIMKRMRQVDLLLQVLPLALTKDQIKEILPAIEKARQKSFDILKLEDDDLLKLDVKVAEALKAGVEKGTYPPRDLQTEVYRLTRAMAVRRQVATGEMVDLVYTQLDKTLNRGQKKAMENSLDPKAFDPAAKPDQMTAEQKMRQFVRFVMLDDQTYELLVSLLKNAA